MSIMPSRAPEDSLTDVQRLAIKLAAAAEITPNHLVVKVAQYVLDHFIPKEVAIAQRDAAGMLQIPLRWDDVGQLWAGDLCILGDVYLWKQNEWAAFRRPVGKPSVRLGSFPTEIAAQAALEKAVKGE